MYNYSHHGPTKWWTTDWIRKSWSRKAFIFGAL